MLKFVLDVGVGNKVWQYLTAKGYDAKLITAINPSMSDSDILFIAESESRMVITMDKDLANWFITRIKPTKAFYCYVLKMRWEKKRQPLCNSF